MEPKVQVPPVVRSRKPLYVLLGLLILLALPLTLYFRSHTTQEVVGGLVASPIDSLESTAGATNLLFMGLGGEGHDAPELTDSMIFVSLSHTDNSFRIISLPRDIWVETLAAKLNTAYFYGNGKREGGGRDLAKSAVSEVLGQPVHYALALDFKGFVQAIDAVGGIDVVVENTFDDYQYPIPGKETAEPESARYEHLHFDAGPTHMDGATALKFARSRHAEGDEGTDFARSKRQQLIMLAFKDKLLDTSVLFDFNRLEAIKNSLVNSMDTDLTDKEFAAFFKFFVNSRGDNQIRSIDIAPQFINPKDRRPYQGQWVLVPSVSYDAFHTYVQENLEP